MDELLFELVAEILNAFLSDYRPALVQVCKRWHAAAAGGAASPPASWRELARRGHAGLLTWELDLRRDIAAGVPGMAGAVLAPDLTHLS